MNTRQLPPIGGAVAPGFEPVREAFARNFSERGELGAACVAYHRGVPVVDLWGGHRDAARRELWEKDTLVLVFSVTKGLAAMAVAVALSRGLLALDAPVATYWPEFARHGKGQITVRQLLAHQAGVPTVDAPLTLARMADRAFLADAIARQAPLWEPGTRRGYHYLTIGWCEDELIRRVDPHGRGIRQYFADEVARPLGLEFYLGLPPEVPDGRIAHSARPRCCCTWARCRAAWSWPTSGRAR